MPKLRASIFLFALLAIALFPSRLPAGDGGGPPAPRQEFRQSTVYPYIFVPVSYLETGGPKQMRFARAIAECAHRDPPPLPAATPAPAISPIVDLPENKEPAPIVTVVPVAPPTPPAFPPPVDAPAAGGPDLTKMPDEVVTYFKNPYNSGPRGPHLFDPIFEPGYHEGPKSKASYEVTDKP